MEELGSLGDVDRVRQLELLESLVAFLVQVFGGLEFELSGIRGVPVGLIVGGSDDATVDMHLDVVILWKKAKGGGVIPQRTKGGGRRGSDSPSFLVFQSPLPVRALMSSRSTSSSTWKAGQVEGQFTNAKRAGR